LITLVLYLWLMCGLLLLGLLPMRAWHNVWIGWLPYWLLITPTLALLQQHRQRVAAALLAFLVRERRRRTPSARYRSRRHAVQVGKRRAGRAGTARPLLIQH
jgi:hypothetical protein